MTRIRSVFPKSLLIRGFLHIDKAPISEYHLSKDHEVLRIFFIADTLTSVHFT